MTALETSPVDGEWRRVRTPRTRWAFAGFAGALLIISVLVFRQQLLVWLGETVVVSDALEHADLIYVLAGDFWGNRVVRGAELGSQGWAPRVLLSGGLYSGGGEINRYSGDLAIEFLVRRGYPRSMFLSFPMDAPSTVGEAQAMRPIFHRLGAKRIILVTANFHSRRALEVFRLFLPEFDFQMEAAPDSNFDPRVWWMLPQQRRLFWSEYQKMIGTLLVRFHLASADWLRQVQQ